jgi:hypothetical protein
VKLMPAAALLAALIVSPVVADTRANAQGVERNAVGKIARSPHARTEFKKANPCPYTGRTHGTCPGYVIDHVKALKRGGAHRPSNMQWQTKAEAKEKDKRE